MRVKVVAEPQKLLSEIVEKLREMRTVKPPIKKKEEEKE